MKRVALSATQTKEPSVCFSITCQGPAKFKTKLKVVGISIETPHTQSYKLAAGAVLLSFVYLFSLQGGVNIAI